MNDNSLPIDESPASLALPEAELIRVLQQSIYPGSRTDSVAMVIGYCRAQGLDPMQRLVHIVPVPKKNARGEIEMCDVIMAGIDLLRVRAARSGQCIAIGEPEFGPDVTQKLGEVEMTFPSWARVTVKRAVGVRVAQFTGVERWLEAYATAGRNTFAPNTMWRKRPYAQLAKCAEAQALRRAFPELSSGPVAEELAGKVSPIDLEPSDFVEPPYAQQRGPSRSEALRRRVAEIKRAPSWQSVAQAIERATTHEQLNAVAELANTLDDEAQRASASELVAAKAKQLEKMGQTDLFPPAP